MLAEGRLCGGYGCACFSPLCAIRVIRGSFCFFYLAAAAASSLIGPTSPDHIGWRFCNPWGSKRLP